MKTNSYLIDFYNTYDEDSRLTSRHGSVEFLTTMRYIQKYLETDSRILEIGAGTGRYLTPWRARDILLCVELIQHNIDIFKK